MTELVVREYGDGPTTVVVVHGGPAAAGDLEPLARRLGKRWRVVEPYQRGSSDQPLTVAMHIRDLADVIRERCDGRPTIVIGHSWGAMLALAHAAAYPSTPSAVVLIGCGTFSPAARSEFERRRGAQLTAEHQAAIAYITETEPDPNRRHGALARVWTRVYGFDVDDREVDLHVVDAVAHAQTWSDMVRLLSEGVYPAAFATITCPVLMLHGETDPHPGDLTRDDLRRHMPQLEYRELPKCGHSPWLEREAKDEFFERLDEWIALTLRRKH
jgi:pimeloyl-ACP methyl ester carboxylesterase